MHKRKRIFFPGSMEVEEYHSFRYGAPGEKRQPKRKATPEQIAAQNQRNREKGIRWLLKNNFQQNDYWITLTYRRDERPPDIETAKEEAGKLIDRLRYQYKKRKMPFKWIMAIEIGSKGGIHFHMVLNRIPDGDALISKCWKKGSTNIKLLYEHGGFQELAAYIAKAPPDVGHYSHSRNLEKPEIKVEVMKRKTWTKDPPVPKGYYLDKDSVVEGINPVTGYPYRHYTLIKLEEKHAKRKSVHRNRQPLRRKKQKKVRISAGVHS